MGKKDKQDIQPRDVTLRIKILPAFTVEVVDDSTGRKWSGHRTYGRTAKEAITSWRSALKLTKEYEADNVTIRSDEPQLARAVSWKEPVFDTSD